MRLNEKTFELNFCAQLPRWHGAPLIWFGLTQMEEARLGFDACTAIGGRILIFQFKVSSRILISGEHRFLLPHDQLTQLQSTARQYPRSVFYVFPLLATIAELTRNPDVVSQSWLLDVGMMPVLIPPTTRSGSQRKNMIHYADVRPGSAIIHSEPKRVDLISAAELAELQLIRADGIGCRFEDFDQFRHFAHLFKRNAVGCIIGSANKMASIA